MRYRDLKAERDAAIARAVEAERLSMKSEFDRLERVRRRAGALTRATQRGLAVEATAAGFEKGAAGSRTTCGRS